MDLSRRSLICTAAAFGVRQAQAAKKQEVHRFRTADAEVEMTVEFHDRYGTVDSWFREQTSNQRFCLSAQGETDRNCLPNFRGSIAIARYAVRTADVQRTPALREYVRTIDRDARLDLRPPFERTIKLEKGIGSDLQAFGYEPSPGDQRNPEDITLVSFPAGSVSRASKRSVSRHLLEARLEFDSSARLNSRRPDMGNRVTGWFSKITNHLWHFRSDEDLKDELQVHLELQAEDNAGSGASPAEARRLARLQLGNTQAVVENVRDQEFITMLESWYRDFALGIRALRNRPVFCLSAILTLAVGIGANTAVFTLLYGLLLRSLPVSEPQQLGRIVLARSTDSRPIAAIPYRMLQQLRGQQNLLCRHLLLGNPAVTLGDKDGTLRQFMQDL